LQSAVTVFPISYSIGSLIEYLLGM
jgi:hypothetical protein